MAAWVLPDSTYHATRPWTTACRSPATSRGHLPPRLRHLPADAQPALVGSGAMTGSIAPTSPTALEHEAEHRPSIIAPGHQRRQPASAAPSGEPVPTPRPRPWRQSSSSIGRGEEASTLDAGRQQRIDHGAALAADPLAPITRKAAIVRAGSTADLTLRQGFLVGPVGPTLVVVVFASPTVNGFPVRIDHGTPLQARVQRGAAVPSARLKGGPARPAVMVLPPSAAPRRRALPQGCLCGRSPASSERRRRVVSVVSVVAVPAGAPVSVAHPRPCPKGTKAPGKPAPCVSRASPDLGCRPSMRRTVRLRRGPGAGGTGRQPSPTRPAVAAYGISPRSRCGLPDPRQPDMAGFAPQRSGPARPRPALGTGRFRCYTANRADLFVGHVLLSAKKDERVGGQ